MWRRCAADPLRGLGVIGTRIQTGRRVLGAKPTRPDARSSAGKGLRAGRTHRRDDKLLLLLFFDRQPLDDLRLALGAGRRSSY